MYKDGIINTHHLMVFEAPGVEADLDSLSDARLNAVLPSGTKLASLRNQLQQGDAVFVSASPTQPLFTETLPDGSLRLNPLARDNSAVQPLLGKLESRFTWDVEDVSPQRFSTARTSIREPDREPNYTPDRRGVVDNGQRWHIRLRTELWDFPVAIPYALLRPDGTEICSGLTDNGRFESKSMIQGERLTLRLFPDSPPAGGCQSESCWQNPEAGPGYLINSGTEIELDETKAGSQDTERNVCFYIRRHPAKALILSPSLTMPALLAADNEELTVILAVDDAISKQFEGDNQNGSGGSNIKFTLLNQLRLLPWGEAYDACTYGLYDRKISWEEIDANVSVHSLAALEGDGKLQSINDDNGKPCGILAGEALQTYHRAGYKQLLMLRCKKLKKNTGLYNLVWLHPQDNIGEYPPMDPAKGLPDSEQSNCYYQPEDELLNQYLSELHASQGAKQLIQQFVTDVELYGGPRPEPRPRAGLYEADTLESNALPPWGDVGDRLYRAHHTVFISNKKVLNPGQLSDIHISSKQHLYPLVKPQVIPGAAQDDSVPIGPQAHRNAVSFKRLLDKMAADAEVDVLAVTGDLYDHAFNCDPDTSAGPVKKTKDLWQLMSEGAAKAPDKLKYPKFIDALMGLSLLHHFMQSAQKPVLYVSGNHEAYDMPYGISPRVNAGGISVHSQRANAGIPVDHNLSIYEACLLYGKDYKHYHKADNFDKENFCWAHHFFSPWRDYLCRYGSKQLFIGLGWGEGENYLKSGVANDGGMLPRATESCTDAQLALVEQGVAYQAPQTLLLSHFTFVNYATDIAFSDTDRKVDRSDVDNLDLLGSDRSHTDEGSFHSNREAVYQHLMDNNIHYTLSGHSHRAGVYQLQGDAGYFTNDVKTQGFYPDGYVHPGDTACLMVSGSSGPVSWQNHNSPLPGCDLEPPQGLKLNLGTGTGTVKIVRDEQVKPRMAAVLDFLWYEKQLPCMASLEGGDGGFTLVLPPATLKAFGDKAYQLIDSIKIHLIDPAKISSTQADNKDHYIGYLELKRQGFPQCRTRYVVRIPGRGETVIPAVRFDVAGAKIGGKVTGLKGFLRKYDGIRDDKLFYLSLTPSDILSPGLDTGVPMAFPVTHSYDKGSFTINRADGKEGEVPDFDSFNDRNGPKYYEFV